MYVTNGCCVYVRVQESSLHLHLEQHRLRAELAVWQKQKADGTYPYSPVHSHISQEITLNSAQGQSQAAEN